MTDTKLRTLKPTTSFLEIMMAINDLSSSATYDSVLFEFNRIESMTSAKATLLAGIIACKTVKKVIKESEAAIGQISDAFRVNSEPNMTMLAMLGHMFFCIPARLTADGEVCFGNYRKSIGNAVNIFAFAGGLAGREKRAEVLRQNSMKTRPDSAIMDDFTTKAMVLAIGIFEPEVAPVDVSVPKASATSVLSKSDKKALRDAATGEA